MNVVDIIKVREIKCTGCCWFDPLAQVQLIQFGFAYFVVNCEQKTYIGRTLPQKLIKAGDIWIFRFGKGREYHLMEKGKPGLR